MPTDRRKESQPHKYRDVVVIGGSLGALTPLSRILTDLPSDFPATVCVVLHVSANSRPLAQLLAPHSKLSVVSARDRTKPEPGVVYVAPPNYHLLLDNEGLRVLHGPREHSARPAIDVLFRSAAVSHGARVCGVLLSGTRSDGVLGITAVKDCGGVTLVQHPKDAASNELPSEALLTSKVDYSIPAEEIPRALVEMTHEVVSSTPLIPEALKTEAHYAARAMRHEATSVEFGERTHFTCPDCDGPIWKLSDRMPHYRCDVGHAFTTDTLLDGQGRAIERALWVAFRVLKERRQLLRRMAEDAQARGFGASADGYLQRYQELDDELATLTKVMNSGAFDPVELGPKEHSESDCQGKTEE